MDEAALPGKGPGFVGPIHIPALDGARAIAVTLVVAYHFGVPGVPGGFLGVDLFFVLSGFLITTLLLNEFAGSGRIDLVRFWQRRARRLLPALFLLVAAIAIWASTADPLEKGTLRWDLLSVIGYVANWRFILSGQSYFDSLVFVSPVRHLWSLAIEEQFYVLWPILVLGALVLIRRSQGGRAQKPVFGLLVAASVASLAVMGLSWNDTDASLAYYSTLARAHELLIGAIFAAVLISRPGVRNAIMLKATPIAFASFAAVIVAAVLMTDQTPAYYFGVSGVFALVCGALISAIWLGSSSRSLPFRILGWGPVAWVGALSYGIYLWHWPMVVWLSPQTTSLDGIVLFVVRVALTLIAASLSFYLVERPIRRGYIRRVRLGPALVFSGAGAAALVLALGSVIATNGARPLPWFLTSEVGLHKSLAGPQAPTIGIVGDSVSGSLYPGMVEVGRERGMSVVSASLASCPVGDSLRTDKTGALIWNTRKCSATAVQNQRLLVEKYQPAVIVWISGRDREDIFDGGRVLQGGTPEWRTALFADWDRTLARLRAGDATVVLVPPMFTQWRNRSNCAAAEALLDPACTEPAVANGALRSVYLTWAAGHPGEIIVLDVSAEYLCPTGPHCPDEVNGIPLFTDLIHFTPEGAALASRWILDELPSGLLATGGTTSR